jgi:hypothetical protein
VIRRRTLGIGAALAFLGSAALLVSGHPMLNWPQAGLPLGTLAAGVLATSLGAMPLAVAPLGGLAHRLCVGAFALSAAWLPMCLLLAGNLRLNFSDGPGSEWATILGVVTLGAILASLVTATVARLAAHWTARSGPQL